MGNSLKLKHHTCVKVARSPNSNKSLWSVLQSGHPEYVLSARSSSQGGWSQTATRVSAVVSNQWLSHDIAKLCASGEHLAIECLKSKSLTLVIQKLQLWKKTWFSLELNMRSTDSGYHVPNVPNTMFQCHKSFMKFL